MIGGSNNNQWLDLFPDPIVHLGPLAAILDFAGGGVFLVVYDIVLHCRPVLCIVIYVLHFRPSYFIIYCCDALYFCVTTFWNVQVSITLYPVYYIVQLYCSVNMCTTQYNCLFTVLYNCVLHDRHVYHTVNLCIALYNCVLQYKHKYYTVNLCTALCTCVLHCTPVHLCTDVN